MVDHDELFRRSLRLQNEGHWDRLGEVMTDDVIHEYPQSGESFRGIGNIRAVLVNYPDLEPGNVDEASARVAATDQHWVLTPVFTPVLVQGSGTTGTAVHRLQYPDGSTWWAVILYELRDDKYCRQTVYFAPEFEAPDWRAPYREPSSSSSSDS